MIISYIQRLRDPMEKMTGQNTTPRYAGQLIRLTNFSPSLMKKANVLKIEFHLLQNPRDKIQRSFKPIL
jgi:hypothetical protein